MRIDRKISMLFNLVVIVLSLVMAVSFTVFETKHINNSMKQRAQLIIDNLAANLEFPVFVRNYEEVRKIMDDALLNKDVVYCIFLDKDNKIQYQTGVAKTANVSLFRKKVERNKPMRQNEELMLGIESGGTEQLGVLEIRVSNEENRTAVISILIAVIFIMILVVLVSSLLSNAFIRTIFAEPIKNLLEGTKKIADGDFNYRVQAVTEDEIGTLARAFNKMTAHLSDTLVTKDYIESIFASVVEALFVTDQNGFVSMVNKAAEEMTARTEADMKGRHISEFFENTDINDLANGNANVEKVCRSADGSIPVLFGASFIRDNSGNLKGFACAAVDIKQLKDVQDSLKRALERIEVYTQELEDNNTKLKELDRLKSSFLSMVSHELRTPLTSIKGYLAFLLRGVSGPLTTEQRDYLESISRNSERLLKLINDLVDITKMEKGTFAVSRVKSDLVVVIEKCIKEMGPMFDALQIIVKTVTSEERIILDIDEYRISQVFINILNNAVKFSPKKSVITVTTSLVEPAWTESLSINMPGHLKDKRCCLVSVRDEGIGIDKQYIEKVFDKFYQIEDINTRKYQGLGLGLNIAKNIVEAHGGILFAESEGAGKGTVFNILLPAE